VILLRNITGGYIVVDGSKDENGQLGRMRIKPNGTFWSESNIDGYTEIVENKQEPVLQQIDVKEEDVDDISEPSVVVIDDLPIDDLRQLAVDMAESNQTVPKPHPNMGAAKLNKWVRNFLYEHPQYADEQETIYK